MPETEANEEAAGPPTPLPRGVAWLLCASGAIAAAVTFIVLAGRSGESAPSMALNAAFVLLTELVFVAFWLLAAGGYGWALGRWLLRGEEPSAFVRLALGIAALLVIDAAAGRIGLLTIGGSLGAWAILAIGWALLAIAVRRTPRFEGLWLPRATELARTHSPAFLAIPAMAVLLLAATSAPGWLWSTEFGGYDALSYHLQLPKEWLALGRIAPLEHNVYSFLPGYIEAAYLHVMIARDDPHEAAYACQLLHAAMTVAAASLTGLLARRVIGGQQGVVAGSAAFALALGTPWTIVVGSLAYNEMAVAMLLAAALLVVRNESLSAVRRGVLVGTLAAAACGAKLTALGFVALPAGVVLLWTLPPRMWWRAVAPGAAAGAIVLSPWLISNALAAGNPLFPFATEFLGTAHWTSEQAATWATGHAPLQSAAGRLSQLWHEFARFGIGANPDPSEPWKPQWSILPWLMLLGAVAGMMRVETRRATLQLLTVVLIQIVFWLLFTHIKSRFMTPTIVPAATLIAIPIASLVLWSRARMTRAVLSAVLGALLLTWSLQPAVIFRTEAGGAPAARIGLARLVAGKGLAPSEHEALARVSPAIWINAHLGPDERVLMVGEAAPYYYEEGKFSYQTTWDRGALSQVMRASDESRDWFAALRHEGFTHLLVNPVMLEIWAREGWNDPILTAQRVIDAAEAHAQRELIWPGGERLYRLPAKR